MELVLQLGGGTYDEVTSRMGRKELTRWKGLFSLKEEERLEEERKAKLESQRSRGRRR
jgi:hypothetical protein